MNPDITWYEVAVRLLLAALAGALVGLDRGESGKAAGLRTTILVCLAAAASMIQVNLLLGMQGRAANSFVMVDLMRFPLGILSGMGFIGAGAILRNEHHVTGVTTAATLWFITVVGLCLGGGQLILGSVLVLIIAFVLRTLRRVEIRLIQTQFSTLLIEQSNEGPSEEALRAECAEDRFEIIRISVRFNVQSARQRRKVILRKRSGEHQPHIPSMLNRIANLPGVQKLAWHSDEP